MKVNISTLFFLCAAKIFFISIRQQLKGLIKSSDDKYYLSNVRIKYVKFLNSKLKEIERKNNEYEETCEREGNKDASIKCSRESKDYKFSSINGVNFIKKLIKVVEDIKFKNHNLDVKNQKEVENSKILSEKIPFSAKELLIISFSVFIISSYFLSQSGGDKTYKLIMFMILDDILLFSTFFVLFLLIVIKLVNVLLRFISLSDVHLKFFNEVVTKPFICVYDELCEEFKKENGFDEQRNKESYNNELFYKWRWNGKENRRKVHNDDLKKSEVERKLESEFIKISEDELNLKRTYIIRKLIYIVEPFKYVVKLGACTGVLYILVELDWGQEYPVLACYEDSVSSEIISGHALFRNKNLTLFETNGKLQLINNRKIIRYGDCSITTKSKYLNIVEAFSKCESDSSKVIYKASVYFENNEPLIHKNFDFTTENIKNNNYKPWKASLTRGYGKKQTNSKVEVVVNNASNINTINLLEEDGEELEKLKDNGEFKKYFDKFKSDLLNAVDVSIKSNDGKLNLYLLGFTNHTGSSIDNLSLADRRIEFAEYAFGVKCYNNEANDCLIKNDASKESLKNINYYPIPFSEISYLRLNKDNLKVRDQLSELRVAKIMLCK